MWFYITNIKHRDDSFVIMILPLPEIYNEIKFIKASSNAVNKSICEKFIYAHLPFPTISHLRASNTRRQEITAKISSYIFTKLPLHKSKIAKYSSK